MSQISLSARHAAVAVVLFSVTLMSQATLVTRTGTSTSANGTTPPPGDAGVARDAFLQLVDPQSVRTEGFEQFNVGETFQGVTAQRPPLAFVPTAGSTGTGTPGTGNLIPSLPLPSGPNDPPPPDQNPGWIASTASAQFVGRFNTTGGYSNSTWEAGKWWEATGDFDIEFASGVNAFGFFITDSNDFLGQLDLVLFDTSGNRTPIEDITGTSGQANGSLQFFGFFDDAKTYMKVSFDITQPAGTAPQSYDVFGLDDLLIGAVKSDPPNPAPEPATLALAVLSLGILAATRRRKTNRT